MKGKLTFAALGTLALVQAGTAPVLAQPRQSAAGVLATSDQYARERIMLRVRASAPMQQARARLEKLYLADAQGKTKAGRATIRRAVDSIAMSSISYIVGDDAARPVAMWTTNAPHRWAGIDMPRSGYGIDNPDNVYRNFAVEAASRYVIHGKVTRPGPIEQHFVIMDTIPGTTPLNKEGGTMVATLHSEQMQIAPDGSFAITVDSDPAAGRRNHLQMPAQGKFLLIVRDLLTDWNQQAIALKVERVAGPESTPLTEAQIAEQAAALLDKIGPYWIQYDNSFIYSRPANTLIPPRRREGGRGFANSGHFALGAGQALAITVDPLGAASLGIQITDPWGVAYEYRNRTSSLNNVQAKPNKDGTITYVIAARDPGVYNWLDPEGFDAGMLAIRWQSVPAAADPAKALRSVQLLPIADLRKSLPAETVFVTRAERKAQQAERAKQYSKRLCGQLSPSTCAAWKP